jgi:AcrR family transcriptional regulator
MAAVRSTRKRPAFVRPEPPRTPKAVATRKRLLDLAAELFIDRGYAAVSLRDIADEAGLTKGAIYGHFRSKGQLLVEVIRCKLADREESDEFLAAIKDPIAALDLMRDPAGRDIRALEVDAAAAARHDPDVAAGMAELYEERDRTIRAAMKGARSPEAMAFIIAALSAGVGSKEATGVKLPPIGPWRDTMRGILVAAFAPPRR